MREREGRPPQSPAGTLGTAVVRLTERQREMGLYSSGLTARRLSERTGISACTALDHLEEIHRRLELYNRAALAALLVREGLL